MDSMRAKPPKGETSLAAKPTWHFIDTSELRGTKNDELRRFVRANAMRDYRRKQKATQDKQKPLIGDGDACNLLGSDSPVKPSDTSSPADNSVSVALQSDVWLQSPDEDQDQAFHWPTVFESTLLELKGVTRSPRSSPALIAAVSSGPQKKFDSPDSRSRTKSFVDSCSPLKVHPGTGVGDPFHTLPTNAPDACELLHHCMSTPSLANTLRSTSIIITLTSVLTTNSRLRLQSKSE